MACEDGDIKTAKELLENGADPAVNNSSSISRACRYGHANIVEILLQDGRADPTLCESWTISHACLKGYTKIVKLLLDDGRANPASNLALEYASRYGHKSCRIVIG